MLRVKFGQYGFGGKRGGKDGKTFEQLFFLDPGYIEWMIRNGVHKNNFTTEGLRRIEELVKRASHLRIPGTCSWCNEDRPITRMFVTQHCGGGLARVDFDCSSCRYGGGSPTMAIRPTFLASEIFRKYDKTGGKILVAAIKRAYFGSESYPITTKRADEFFDNPKNFVNF